MTANTLLTLGEACAELDDKEQALDYLKESLCIKQRCLPAGHPDLAELYVSQSRLVTSPESELLLSEAVSVYSASLGATHPLAVEAQLLLARVHLADGHRERAQQQLLAAQQLVTESSPEFLQTLLAGTQAQLDDALAPDSV